MKEYGPNNKDEVKIHAEKQQEKQLKFIGSITPHQGHTCFELNMDTNMIDKATFQEVAIDFGSVKNNKAQGVKKKLIVKDNCIYTTALNVKNADKKFRKMLGV